MVRRVLVILVLVFLSLQVTATSKTYQWSVPEGWYGYPVVAGTEYRNDLCIITQESGTVQSWSFDGSEWVIDNTNIGISVLSNIVEYKNALYMSVSLENDSSAVVEFNGIEWNYVNETVGKNVRQLVTHNTLLLALTNQTEQVMEFTGLDWKDATWDDNITDPIESIASYNGRLYVLMQDNQRMYEVTSTHIEEMEIPNFGIFPRPIIEFNGLLWSAYRNQIFTYNGYNWTLQKVIDPLQHVTTMHSSSDTLYIGTQNIMWDNESQVLFYDTNGFTESQISGSIVYSVSMYQDNVYAGTNLGLFMRTESVQQFHDQVTYIIWATLVLSLVLLLYAGFTWNRGFEDIMLVAGGFALLSVSLLLYGYPDAYLTYVTLILPIVVFFVLLFILDYYLEVGFDLRYTEKDIRIIVLVLLILLGIEIGFQLFSRALGIWH